MAFEMRFRTKKRPPPPHQVATYMINQAREVLSRIGKQSMTQRQKTTKTWSGDSPNWHVELSTPGAYQARLEVVMEGTVLGMKKWYWVSKGTKIRYGTMTKGFKPKTKVKTISSYKGKGQMWYVNIKKPRPGIDARLFDETINERMDAKVEDQMETRIARALKRKRF